MGAGPSGTDVKLALDHHYSRRTAEQLRELGHDVVAAVEVGWETMEDRDVLDRCRDEGRALLTNNVADFALIARRWQESGQEHLGIVFTSDSSMPRTMDTIGRYVEVLDDLVSQYPGRLAFAGRVHWLSG